MASYKTPGVYVEEISTLPASVAPVATAIPAFVGYTELHPTDKPIRITSLLEYREKFGASKAEAFQVTLSDGAGGTTDIAIADPAGGLSNYVLYYQLQMYFANGGGPCYVVSAGKHKADGTFDKAELIAAIDLLEEEDEPTILLVPEAVLLGTSGDRADINNALLEQCNKLQDRVAVLDVTVVSGNTVLQDAAAFRSNEVGSSYLKYGAAYYPQLKTTLVRYYDEDALTISDNRGGAGAGIYHDYPLSVLALGDEYAIGKITITDSAVIDGDTFTIGSDTYTEGGGADFIKGAGNATTAANLAGAITAANSPDYEVADRASNVILIRAKVKGSAGLLDLDYTDSGTGVAAEVSGVALELVPADTTLYNDIKKEMKSTYTMNLYPGATMAGIYARTDRDRGVWKAPANVSVNGIYEPAVLVTPAEQADLNVDPTSGKSINAIRPFAGKGTLVWGARTLAGNDNEWRYVPVRRFFNFMEESIQKATEPSVFEPNTANTWSRLKAMIENFLTQLWSAGALAGATPQHAFFVNVGLGKTMTAQDILEGRLIIEVGVAAVRPAEFIILKFSHKLQES